MRGSGCCSPTSEKYLERGQPEKTAPPHATSSQVAASNRQRQSVVLRILINLIILITKIITSLGPTLLFQDEVPAHTTSKARMPIKDAAALARACASEVCIPCMPDSPTCMAMCRCRLSRPSCHSPSRTSYGTGTCTVPVRVPVSLPPSSHPLSSERELFDNPWRVPVAMVVRLSDAYARPQMARRPGKTRSSPSGPREWWCAPSQSCSAPGPSSGTTTGSCSRSRRRRGCARRQRGRNAWQRRQRHERSLSHSARTRPRRCTSRRVGLQRSARRLSASGKPRG